MEAVGGERFGFGRMMVEPVEIAQVMGCMSWWESGNWERGKRDWTEPDKAI
jgi:hypothetical protein